MISKLTLKNFRQHRELALSFAAGLTALRGVNEAGKSTILEAILFALFGIRACRNNDICSWGEPEKATKVELELILPIGTLHISRSKSSAEVRVNGETVTGQTECTRFIEAQLQLQPGLGPKLMVARQADIQGVLDEKGGETATKLIEELADLAVIDRVIDKIQAKYPTGSTRLVEQRIETAEAGVVTAQAALAEARAMIVPDDEDVLREEGVIEELATQMENLRTDLQLAQQERDEAARSNDTRAKVIRQLHAAEDNLQNLKDSKAKLEQTRPTAAGELDIGKLSEELQCLQSTHRRYLLLQKFNAAASKAGDVTVFAGTKAELVKRQKGAAEMAVEFNAKLGTIPHRRETLQTKLVTSSVCGFCAKDVSEFPDVAAKNAAIQAEIEALQVESQKLVKSRDEAKAYAADYTRLLDQPSLLQFHIDHPHLFAADCNVYPERVIWIGGDVSDMADQIAQVEQQMLQAERNKAAIAQFERQMINLISQIEEAKIAVETCERTVSTLPPCLDTEKLTQRVDELAANIVATQDACATVQRRVADMRNQIDQRATRLRAALKSLEGEQLYLERAKEELAEITFNSNLIKKLRAARPEIANKVWNSVLGAVSRYFSTMRGEKSVVTKDGSSFLVNGKEVGSYSGSTKDILGLALRVALLRTFLPACNFMLLDEPFAACDDGRQTAALGFLAGAGFNQMLVITHEDISETVADNLLTL